MKALNAKIFKATALASALFAAPVFFAKTPIAAYIGSQAIAQEAEEEQETRRVPSMTPKVGKKFAPVLEVFELESPTPEDFRKALSLLQSYNTERWNGYEKAMYWRYTAGIYATIEEYGNSKNAYIEMLNYRTDIQPRMEQETLLMIAKLETVDENWDGALAYLGEWWELVPKVTMEGYRLRGTFRYQKKNYSGALDDILVVVADAESKNGMAKKNEYEMLFGIYSELGRPDDMLLVAETLVRHYPDAATWKRLYAMYLDREQTDKALAAMQVCYEEGYFDRESQISTFASLWSQADSPFLAAKYFAEGMDRGIVEKTQKNYEYLANWWYQAREYLKSLEARKFAAEMSDDGNNWLLLARAQLAESMNLDVVESVDRAVSKGELRDVAEAYIIQGQAYIGLKEYYKARDSFRKAGNVEGRSSAYAEQYEKFVQSKIDVIERLSL